MAVKYTITDYTFNPVGLTTVIDEPVGWDALAMRLKRDKTWHGFFDFFDDALSPLQFDSKGGKILRAAYDEAGIDAYVELKIEFHCSDTDSYEVLYTGKFQFARYSDNCGDRCFVECGVEATSCIMTFKNRYDQKVDLDSLVPFDDCECGDTATAGGGFNAGSGQILLTSLTGHALTDLLCLKEGATITITGSTSNNGEYTIVTFALGESSSTITVAEPLTDELGSFTISGCLFQQSLPEYDGLNKEITLPPKLITFKNDWGIASNIFNYTDDLLDSEAIGTPGTYFFPFEWDIERLTEILDSSRTRNLYSELNAAPGSPADNFRLQNDGIIKIDMGSALKCSGETAISIQLEGSVTLQSIDTISFDGSIQLVYGNDADGYTTEVLASGFNTGNTAIPFSINFSDTITLRDNDRVYIYLLLINVQYLTGGGGGGPADPFDLTIEVTEGNVTVGIDTICEATKAGIYLINEVMSRCTEAYTNDCLRVYSDYFGRTDAQPYPSDEDGCAGLTSITNGLKIRADDADGKIVLGDAPVNPKVTVSMKEVFDAMNAVFNIGMGIEEDPNRPGSELIRVEPMNYFYKPDVLMTCDKIAEVKREINTEMLFSIFKCGYEKWETESTNGLNDVFGKREYRTTLKNIRNTYDRICKFIASDYAIEFTRRQFGATTKDWRYDNNTFIICLNSNWKGKASFFHTEFAPFNVISFQSNDVALTQIQIGDTITITGAVNPANNGTFTVTGNQWQAGDLNVNIEVAEAVVGEFDADIVLTNTTTPLYIVDQGNVVSSANILYPEYCYNLRISPARNALRHFKTILMSYRQYLDGELKFTNGEGNFIAQLELEAFFDCLDEDGLFAENEDISLNDFVSPEDHHPMFRPERVRFEYPMSYEEYKAVKANPYGVIEFQCGSGAMEQGWIEDLKYSPYKGMAEFILKPKITA